MKLSIQREPLVEALSRLTPISSGSKMMPILGNIYLRATNQDSNDLLQLDACDLETAMRVWGTSCQIEEPGGVCLDAKKLFDIARAVSGAQIELSTNEKHRTLISCGSSAFELNGFDGDDFPVWPELTPDLTIAMPKGQLITAINQVMFAASNDDSRFNLNAVLVEVSDGALKMVATDGHRLAIATDLSVVLADNTKLLVPKKSMAAIRRFIEKVTGNVEIQVAQKHITISIEGSTLACRLIDGDFPDYNKVIPSTSGMVATIEKLSFKKSLEMVRLMTSDRNRGVVLNLGLDSLTVSANHPDLGTAQDSIVIDYKADPIEIIANVEYLIENLNAIETDQIEMEYVKEGSPVILRPKGTENYFNLVMPMRK